MKTAAIWAFSILALSAFLVGGSARSAEESKPVVQIALLLDTSNSMDGLIDQARTQLWKIVNEFIVLKRQGKRPELQVALYEYGNDNLPADKGHMRQVVPLTTDLDKVSEELFALKTRGGYEFCGMVIQLAAQELSWSGSKDALKLIFIAGNEPFTQGTVDFHKSCAAAIAKGVAVNTIYCGPYEEGVATDWKNGAALADGSYMNIDQNQQVAHVDAPQDKEIARLGAELNNTYIPYGAQGRSGQARQEAQDSNALSAAKGAAVQRAVSKASGYYNNASWDLVDGVKQGQIKLAEVDEKALPENLQKMSADERKVYVETKLKEREKLQQTISQLSEERKQYVAKKMAELSKGGSQTLDAAMIAVIRQQASQKGLKAE